MVRESSRSGWMQRFFPRSPDVRQRDPATLFVRFKAVLAANNRALEAITDLGEKLGGEYLFDVNYTKSAYFELYTAISEALKNFTILTGNSYPVLGEILTRIDRQVQRVITETQQEKGPLFVSYPKITWDLAEDVGGKNYHLALIGNDLKIKTPKGFAITTKAFDLFIEHNHLNQRLQSLPASKDLNKDLADLRRAVMTGTMPKEFEADLTAAVRKLTGRYGRKHAIAVRSSAEEEDGDFSFAGQFESVLNVPASNEDIETAWRKVAASLFTDRAAAYQLHLGYDLGRLRMAAACVRMIPARASGVIYTVAGPGQVDTLLINGSWGLGPAVVDGITDADLYLVSKGEVPAVKEIRLGKKELMVVDDGRSGIKTIPTPMAQRNAPCLNEEQVLSLARRAQRIEKYFRKPQDIEWALDEKGEIFILQSRALKIDEETESAVAGNAHPDSLDLPILLHNQGTVVRSGITAGRVFIMNSQDDLEQVPRGAVLVARHDSPQYVRVIPFINAIITDTGVATSHMASICREFEIPTIVNTGNGSELLANGKEVTVQANSDGEITVYDGVARKLLQKERQNSNRLRQIYEFRRQKYLMRYIAPLHLINPLEEDFVPEKCRSIHDLIRFMHEMSVQAIVSAALDQARNLTRKKSSIHELELHLPIRMLVIDIGGALAENSGMKVSMEQIRSKPLIAVLQGFTQTGGWSDEAVPLKGLDFLAGMARSTDVGNLSAAAGANLAVASADYVNLGLRFGYHFNMLDCYCTDQPRNNHIFFRFVGGAATITSRSLRIHFMSRVLGNFGFMTKSKGDLLVARVSNLPRKEIEKMLAGIGRLIACARQLDAALVSIEAAEDLAADFLAGHLPKVS
jgi:pyruvate, water dikinase